MRLCLDGRSSCLGIVLNCKEDHQATVYLTVLTFYCKHLELLNSLTFPRNIQQQLLWEIAISQGCVTNMLSARKFNMQPIDCYC